jgi:hypothetical protein
MVAALAAESDEAAALFAGRVKARQQYPDWAQTYLNGWSTLKFDRSYSHGGFGRIWNGAMRSYARDLGLVGEDAADFVLFVTVLDDEYMDVTQEQIAAAAGKE